MSKDLRTEIRQFTERLAGLHIAVLGDLILDRYVKGKVSRISPEAPVPIVQQKSLALHLGGAANVMANLVAMGAGCSLIGIVGKDESGVAIANLIGQSALRSAIILEDATKPTTVKTRIIAGGHHLLRIDEESEQDISSDVQQQLIEKLGRFFKEDPPDILIIEDYNKGLLTPHVIAEVLGLCDRLDIPVAVDPKRKNFFLYQQVDLFKPNLKEAQEALGIAHMDNVDIQTIGDKLFQHISCRTLMVTMAAEGIYLKDAVHWEIFPTKVRNVADVSGAGDTVISLAAICRALSLSHRAMALICNTAGGIVCEMPGVVPVDKVRLLNELNEILV